MRILCVIAFAFLLNGCGTLVNRAVEAQGAARAGAEFTLCRAISVGEWIRHYGPSSARASAWRTLCVEVAHELPVPERADPVSVPPFFMD